MAGEPDGVIIMLEANFNHLSWKDPTFLVLYWNHLLYLVLMQPDNTSSPGHCLSGWDTLSPMQYRAPQGTACPNAIQDTSGHCLSQCNTGHLFIRTLLVQWNTIPSGQYIHTQDTVMYDLIHILTPSPLGHQLNTRTTLIVHLC